MVTIATITVAENMYSTMGGDGSGCKKRRATGSTTQSRIGGEAGCALLPFRPQPSARKEEF